LGTKERGKKGRRADRAGDEVLGDRGSYPLSATSPLPARSSVSSPNGVRGEAPADVDFGAFVNLAERVWKQLFTASKQNINQ